MAASLNFIPFLIRAILFHNLGDQNDKNYPKYNTKNFVLITQYSPLPWQWAILFTKGYSWQQSTDYDFRNFLSWQARAMTRSKQEMNYHSTNLGHQLRHCMLWNYSKIFLKLAEFFFKATNKSFKSSEQSRASLSLGRNSAALLHSGYEIIRSRKINMRYYQWQVLKFHSLVVGYKKSLSFYQQHSNINWKGCQSPTVGLSVSSNSIKAIYNAIIIQNSRITLVFYVKSFSDTS